MVSFNISYPLGIGGIKSGSGLAVTACVGSGIR